MTDDLMLLAERALEAARARAAEATRLMEQLLRRLPPCGTPDIGCCCSICEANAFLDEREGR